MDLISIFINVKMSRALVREINRHLSKFERDRIIVLWEIGDWD